MQFKNYLFLVPLLSLLSLGVAAQVASPTPAPAFSTLPKPSMELAARLEKLAPDFAVTRQDREAAYSKLLEAQRYIWTITSSQRGRSPGIMATNAEFARRALIRAIELDPRLSEAYTALAETYLSVPPSDVGEAIALATIATRLDKDSFGARRILARLMTYKSGLSTGKVDASFASKAISNWSEIARLDPRNAEAWAFLAAFYDKTGKPDDEIVALKQWLSAAPSLDSQFYQRTMGGNENLTPENASLKLASALSKAGKVGEAIEVVSLMISDSPDNQEALDLLGEALRTADAKAAAEAAPALEQALYANPNSVPMIDLLSRVYIRAGKIDKATALLKRSAEKTNVTDRGVSAALYAALGDVYSDASRWDEAIASYGSALAARGLDWAETISPDEREMAMIIFDKIIRTYKAANRPKDVIATIERSKALFGADDLFADRQMISFYRESGDREHALLAVRSARKRAAGDYGLIRLEATLLTELGRVDAAVAMMRALGTPVKAAPGSGAPSTPAGFDEFSNLLFISNLYSMANRGREASAAANEAYAAAKGSERKQIAKLTLATAQQAFGDFTGAEATLRTILNESPNNPIAQNNLGYFLVERNEKLVEALDLIERAHRVDPTNPSYLDSLGWAYFRMGKLDESEKFLKEAVRLDTGSSTIAEHLGDVYEKQGKADTARTYWAKALLLASDTGDISRLKTKLSRK